MTELKEEKNAEGNFFRCNALLGRAANDAVDEFAELKELVETLRSALPLQTEKQRQIVGSFMLAALWLGKGRNDFADAIKPNAGFSGEGAKRPNPLQPIVGPGLTSDKR